MLNEEDYIDSPTLWKMKTSQGKDQRIKLIYRSMIIKGDILIWIMNKGTMSKSEICWLSFNTSFLHDTILEFWMRDLDPNGIRKDSWISKDIWIDLVTKPYCKSCNNKTEIQNLCNACRKELSKEIKSGKLINQIIEEHIQ